MPRRTNLSGLQHIAGWLSRLLREHNDSISLFMPISPRPERPSRPDYGLIEIVRLCHSRSLLRLRMVHHRPTECIEFRTTSNRRSFFVISVCSVGLCGGTPDFLPGMTWPIGRHSPVEHCRHRNEFRPFSISCCHSQYFRFNLNMSCCSDFVLMLRYQRHGPGQGDRASKARFVRFALLSYTIPEKLERCNHTGASLPMSQG